MNSRLFNELEKKIEEWMKNNCESQEWLRTNIWFGTETANKMAAAATAVFDGIAEAEEYERQENSDEE